MNTDWLPTAWFGYEVWRLAPDRARGGHRVPPATWSGACRWTPRGTSKARSLSLNPFAVGAGVLSLALLAMHGANSLAFKTEGGRRDNARLWAGRLWWAVAGLAAVGTGFALFARPDLGTNFGRQPPSAGLAP